MTHIISAQSEQSREAARSRATGRFGGQQHSAPEAVLPVTTESLLESRRAQLAALGFVPAQPQMKLADTESADLWWKRTESIAEGGRYDLMPRRDETGKSARLRTYEGTDTKVRMPSVSAVRRHAASGQTFDVPVEAVTPHGPITGHVRVTHNGNGRYSVSAVGMPAEHAEYVAESVLASLEARRPSRALSDVRDILLRRRERLASQGVRMKAVDSSWIQGVGYNPNDEQLVMNLQGRFYGYRVDRETYEDMMSSYSIGAAYNALVKKVAPKFEVTQHEECGNYFYAGAEHRCPSVHNAPRQAQHA
ncbi:KTSC domain-containing protein [Microbacterium sp. 77mftsu3.1]|uniref:KTSC domain-containing protein n=1 Tax=Microbacterium sp. 77mftsu3.1 TaxID=1761802 RepID=UPI00036F2789|nr:KTSC domain-containing protein [Microbacterium sp. 77mftsu3.1]